MGLSFVFGSSGSGKSTYVYNYVSKEAEKYPDRKFYIMVPDQFTMQTQKELVENLPSHGIMNIDVLSFGRLSYRIFEETGRNRQELLDDTGKNLILRLLAARNEDRLTYLKADIKKQGYIHEVKSAISEFMQYNLGTDDLKKMMEYTKDRGILTGKLRDLSFLYEEFEKYIKNRFLTTEESLGVLAERIEKSAMIKDSVIVFDGFTGFTPIQIRVIRELMIHASKVIFTLTVDGKENPFLEDGEQKLFHLTKKTACKLEKVAEEAGVERQEDCILCERPVYRLRNSKTLDFLEENLFRYRKKVYLGKPDGLEILEAPNLREEVREVVGRIHSLIRKTGCCYRDIAVVCGNLQGYESHIRSEFGKGKIPFFMDRTTGITMNPFVEYIRSALLIHKENFSKEAVTHFLRTGLTDFSEEDIDELDNYLLATGVRGKERWGRTFTASRKGDSYDLNTINELREKLLEQILMLYGEENTAKARVERLYSFIEVACIQEKLLKMEKEFEAEGDLVRAGEYRRIYPYLIDLLSQMHALLGEEELSDREFMEILDAGFMEIQVGTIPQNVDRVVIGDMERTRLKEIKHLFFMGVNDGNIPGSVNSGGILSDIDREFLKEGNWELSPGPREKMYIQRLYLYTNMTKPSYSLFLSYSCTSGDGKALRPSYLISMTKKLYPDIKITITEDISELEMLRTPENALPFIATSLREYVRNELSKEDEELLFSLLSYLRNTGEKNKEVEELVQGAFLQYHRVPLDEKLALTLYDSNPVSSVTRLETYAGCAYAHFLKYGLGIQEREEYSFEASDIGSLLHGVLAEFSQKLQERGYTWKEFPEKEGEEILHKILESEGSRYGNGILHENARNRYALNRLYRILLRTIKVVHMQIKAGSFLPEEFERSFMSMGDLESLRLKITENSGMSLTGRIDRIDVCKENNECYVTVVDYKSGNKAPDITGIYYGLDLQLMTYLQAAMEYEKKKNPNMPVRPAGVLYYHLDDPIFETEENPDSSEIEKQLAEKLRMQGFVNDSDEIIKKIDATPGDALTVLPLTRKKDGSFRSNQILMEENELLILSDFVHCKMESLAGEIYQGCISINPYERGTRTACDYCTYKGVCRFDSRIPGYETRKLSELSREEVYEKIDHNGEKEDGN